MRTNVNKLERTRRCINACMYTYDFKVAPDHQGTSHYSPTNMNKRMQKLTHSCVCTRDCAGDKDHRSTASYRFADTVDSDGDTAASRWAHLHLCLRVCVCVYIYIYAINWSREQQLACVYVCVYMYNRLE